jgi:cysteine desulfurase
MSHPLKPRTIYLDHAATTPLDPVVHEAMLPHLRDNFGNPSSIHHIGRAAFDTLSQARQSLGDSLGVTPEEIILTGSGTESDNLALLGLARAHREHGKHIIVSAIEHKAVLAAAAQLESEGFSVTYLPVDEHGLVSLDTLRDALTDETILVSIMYANNEIGTIQPIVEISELLADYYARKRRPLFHTDACQAVGMLPISPRELGVDAMTINSSKIYGPKGIGLLYLRAGIPVTPLLVGGGQEGGRRAGTENVALAVGFAKALEIAVHDTDVHASRLAALQTHFLAALQTLVPTHLLNGHPTKRLPNNVHLCIPDIEGEAMLLLLDNAGICAATGSACNASDLEASHVLRAIGRSDDIIHGSLRFSFGRDTTEGDLTYTAKTLGKVVHRLLSMTASSLSITKTYAKQT